MTPPTTSTQICGRNPAAALVFLGITLVLAFQAQAQPPAFDPLAPGAVRPKPKPTTPTTPGQPAAQPKTSPRTQPAPAPRPKPPVRKKTDEEDELKPRLEKLITKDNVRLQMGYFPSDRGKKAPPILLIHEWGGQTSPYMGLARKLQEEGCAVALLDYRGHGRSKVETSDDSRRSRPETATKRSMEEIAKFDIEAAKKFLKSENDAEKLNLNALTVIGIRQGTILAMNWAVMDWSWPALGSKKQGQDVKAMILISPMKSVNGLTGDAAIKHPVISRMPVMLLSGSDLKERSEAGRLEKMFEKSRVASKFDKNTVPYAVDAVRVRAKLSGADLVRKTPGLTDRIAKFVIENVASNQDKFEWISRSE